MASFGDRLGRILRGFASPGARPSGERLGDMDPDEILRAAAAEEAARPRASAPPPRGRAAPPAASADAELKRAYANLELTPPSSLEEAKVAWRKLMLQFHPDKFQDAAQVEKATKVATRLTEAYRLVREHLERKPG